MADQVVSTPSGDTITIPPVTTPSGDTTTPPMQIGLDLRLMVGAQVIPIHMEDVDAVKNGTAPFDLFTKKGITLELEKLLNFLEVEFKFDRASLPKAAVGLLGNTSITLNEFYYKAPKGQSDSPTKKGDFKVSITVAFSKNDTNGGLLKDLLGVDMHNLLEIQEVTIVFMQGNIPLEIKKRGFNVAPFALPDGQPATVKSEGELSPP